MKLLYVLYTFNRPGILAECFQTIFYKNDLRPDRMVIIDDGSDAQTQSLLSYYRDRVRGLVIDFVFIKQNIGYGRAAEIGFALADIYQPQYCFFIESDYLFRKHGLDDVMEVLESDIGRQAAGVAGFSHPDFASEFHHKRFADEMIRNFGSDPCNREKLFKPTPFKASRGEIQTQFTSNSCGTMYLNWDLIAKIFAGLPEGTKQYWVGRTCSKGERKPLLDDGLMAEGLCYYWNQYAMRNGLDRAQYQALIDIIPSVANHFSGGGTNSPNIPEGQTEIVSPTWQPEQTT